MTRKVLFVEGETDTYFFYSLIKSDAALSGLQIEIEPKRGVTKIPVALTHAINDLRGGRIEQLGIIADADHNGVNNGGFHNRWSQLTNPLQNEGYIIPSSSTIQSQNQGSIFNHSNGLPNVGLWLMPNHYDDGSLEDLVLNTVVHSQVVCNVNNITQQNLIAETNQTITNLGTKNLKAFQTHHDSKAKAFTWLAWQKKPRHFIGEVIDYKNPQDNLIDINSPEIQGLLDWLKQVFV